jgi:hypothetical protein
LNFFSIFFEKIFQNFFEIFPKNIFQKNIFFENFSVRKIFKYISLAFF